MGSVDFPAWFGASLYGGLASAALSALIIASWALLRRRGLSGQVVVALLTCLVASIVDVVPISWAQNRLGVYGPTLHSSEVAVALVVTALSGWAAPLGAMIWYVLYAAPVRDDMPAASRTPAWALLRVEDPARQRQALPEGQVWGALRPGAAQPDERPIPLTREMVLVGRDPGADLTLSDESVSRFHVELRWHGDAPWIEDLGSLNGTRVNRMASRGRTPLHTGDRIEIGDLLFTFEFKESAAGDGRPISQSHASGLGLPAENVETRKTSGVSGVFGSTVATIALVWASDSSERKVWPLRAPVTTIGRDANSTVTLPDDSVSRAHAQITRQPTGYFVTDLESSNGVLLNGEPVTSPTRISPGDVLQLGDVILNVRDAGEMASGSSKPVDFMMGAGGTDSGPHHLAPPPLTIDGSQMDPGEGTHLQGG